MTFYKSKNKINLLLICLLLMLVGIPLVLRILNIIHTIAAFAAADVVFLPFAFHNVLKQKRQSLEINEKIKFFNGTEITSIDIAHIRSLKYKGLFFVPMSEMMVIESINRDSIYIDFNFIKYKKIWGYILDVCKQNPNIEIESQLYKYTATVKH